VREELCQGVSRKRKVTSSISLGEKNPAVIYRKKKIGMNSRGGKEEKRGLVDNTLEQGWAAKAMDADEQRRGERERKKKSLLFLESIRKRVFS